MSNSLKKNLCIGEYSLLCPIFALLYHYEFNKLIVHEPVGLVGTILGE